MASSIVLVVPATSFLGSGGQERPDGVGLNSLKVSPVKAGRDEAPGLISTAEPAQRP